jgi:FolB domain-containing protein
MHCTLKLNQFALMVSLGCSPEERSTLQKVLVDVSLHFPKLPNGVLTDELSDTICYSSLAKGIRRFCENKSFKLLEYFTHQLFLYTKDTLLDIPITITVTKYPPTANLDHCTFTLSDKP